MKIFKLACRERSNDVRAAPGFNSILNRFTRDDARQMLPVADQKSIRFALCDRPRDVFDPSIFRDELCLPRHDVLGAPDPSRTRFRSGQVDVILLEKRMIDRLLLEPL